MTMDSPISMSNNPDEEIKSNIEKQLSELEILQSIYANSNELVIEDEYAVEVARLFVNDQAQAGQLYNIGFVIRFTAEALADETPVKPLSTPPLEKQYIQVSKR